MPEIAIDIGGTKTAAALFDETRIIERTAWASPAQADAAIERILEVCRPWASNADGAGVAFGGQFDFAAQRCIRSMHVASWNELPLPEMLQRSLEIPVLADNDANVAALGEYRRFSVSRDPLLYVTLSTGLGASIVINGQVVRGAYSLAGELGHVPIGHEDLCNCGQRGCLERAVSGYWIEKDQDQSAAEYLHDDENFRAWLNHLVNGLWIAITMLDPGVIILGGGITHQGARLLEELRTAMDARANLVGRKPPRIDLGDATGRTVLLGAAVMAKEASRGQKF